MKQHFGKYLGPSLVDESEPITAWRVWRINPSGKQPLLHSSWTATGRSWLPKVATIAECVDTGGKGSRCHISMGKECECGLWACKRLSGLIEHSANKIGVPVYEGVAAFLAADRGCAWDSEGRCNTHPECWTPPINDATR